jgi:hypothetical protein
MVFRLNSRGCYAFLLLVTNSPNGNGDALNFKLTRRYWSEHSDIDIVPWTIVDDGESKLIEAQRRHAGGNVRISVEAKGDRMTMLVDDIHVAELQDGIFADGYVGMTMFGPALLCSVISWLKVQPFPLAPGKVFFFISCITLRHLLSNDLAGDDP